MYVCVKMCFPSPINLQIHKLQLIQAKYFSITLVLSAYMHMHAYMHNFLLPFKSNSFLYIYMYSSDLLYTYFVM